MGKKVNLQISQIDLFPEIFSKKKYFAASNIESNIAYYYTLYTFKFLIGKMR